MGWHHQLNGYELEQTLEDSEGQGSLACCSPQGHRESDATQRLTNNKSDHFIIRIGCLGVLLSVKMTHLATNFYFRSFLDVYILPPVDDCPQAEGPEKERLVCAGALKSLNNCTSKICESTLRSGASWAWPPCSPSCLGYEADYQYHSCGLLFLPRVGSQ